MIEERDTIIDTLRGRILRGLRAGTIEPGMRLPSARKLVAEFGVDHRLILAAYRQLATEGLVDIRERGGVYTSLGGATRRETGTIPVSWVVDTFAAAYAHEIAGPDLSELMRRSLETLRLHAVVIASTHDQVAELARELCDDFGLIAEGFVAKSLHDETVYLAAVKRAHVVIATAACIDLATALGQTHGKPVVAIEIRPNLVTAEWEMLLRQEVWAIVATKAFGAMVTRLFADVQGSENLHILVYGKDDLSIIPEGAPTYVTQRVRESITATETKGRLLPPTRTIGLSSARQIFDFIVRANLRAVEALHTPPNAEADRPR